MTEETKPKRIAPVPVRLSAEQRAWLDRRAAELGMTRNEYMKRAILGLPIVPKADRKDDAHILAATANIKSIGEKAAAVFGERGREIVQEPLSAETLAIRQRILGRNGRAP